METSQDKSTTNNLNVLLFSDANFLSLNILENLLSKNCFVNIVSSDLNNWKERTSRLNSPKLSLLNLDSDWDEVNYSYAVFCGGFLNKENAIESYLLFEKLTVDRNIKTLYLFPFESFSLENSNKIKVTDNSSIIYIGDLLGARVDLQSDLLVSRSVSEILTNRELTLGIGEFFYPMFVSDVAKTITKWLFSFGPYGKEMFLLGPQVSASTFWKENNRLVPGIKILYDNNVQIRSLPKGYDIKTLETNLIFVLTETYKWYSQNFQPAPKVVKKIVKEVKQKEVLEKPKRIPSKFEKPLKNFLVTLIFLLSIPVLLTIITGGLFFVGYKSFVSGNTKGTENYVLIGKSLLVLSEKESLLLENVPVVGRVYKETFYLSKIGQKTADVVVAMVPTIKSASEMFNNVLGDTVYDPAAKSSEIKTSLDFVYQNVAFISLETESSAKAGLYSARYVSSKIDFEKLKNLLVQGSYLADGLPNILGKSASKSYLVLFQNNMELRPTGGFIGSFGVMNMDGGRMSGLNVNDVYSADGQLRGHVEPPAPIKNYLGEANWWLRDSNWDPDFPTSAQRAEWFLDKELDQKVDGVVAVDLQVIQDILKYTGPIFLSDFNLEVTDKNIYEKTQEEVQSDFFPGTHKKASFLTALSRQLLLNVSKMDNNKKIYILKSFFADLEGRHVQVYLHDQPLELAVSKMGWGGGIDKLSCGDGCYPDMVALVEANLGVNKANYFLKRSADLTVNLSNQDVVRSLNVTYKNTANPALGLAGKYKVYVRILVPDDSEIVAVKNYTGSNEQTMSPDITTTKDKKEVGVLIEVLAGQEERLQFVWQSPVVSYDPLSSYGLYIRKQAGVQRDPWAVTLDSTFGKLKTSYGLSLTGEGLYKYNTNLDRDFFSKVSW